MSTSHDPKDGAASVEPADEIEIETFRFQSDCTVPNNPDLPVVLMRRAFGGAVTPGAVTARMEAAGWGGTWVWRVFDYHHYHPNAHEALAVASGWAVLMLGGPKGEEVTFNAGDVVVLPAGTGHCQIDSSEDFRVCGAYPPGQEDYETIRAEQPYENTVLERIASVSLPKTDPVHGAKGPLVEAWAVG